MIVLEVCCGDYGYFHDRLVSAIDNGRCIYNSRDTQLEEVDLCKNGKRKVQETQEIRSEDFDHESGWLRQFSILIMRMWLQMWRDKVSSHCL